MQRLLRPMLALLLLVAAVPALAAEHYMVMFAAETPENTARTAHTFATFVTMEDGALTEELTISWLPAPGHFGPGYSMPPFAIVPGKNYTLDETIRISPRRRTTFWGPYEISPSLHERAARRVAYLDRSVTSYKMMNLARGHLRDAPLRNRPGGAINCIMAVSDVGGFLSTGTAWGIDASSQVLSFLSRDVLDPLSPAHPHPEVAAAMDLYRRLGR